MSFRDAPLSCFNPLHCGAVVASQSRSRARVDASWFQSPSLRGSGRFEPPGWRLVVHDEVSIPFIAGQWSLRGRQGASPGRHEVSIPFIAGQWSLQATADEAVRSQLQVSIPFIAGQWSLPADRARAQARAQRFNPLHCGAVVASFRARASAEALASFQSPSLRGSGRFAVLVAAVAALAACFNPLHCGAVVASSAGAAPGSTPTGFNPLHCGAVVASARYWIYPASVRSMFQSPSLRGSGRFSLWSLLCRWSFLCFNPLHCGAVVASCWGNRSFG